MKKLMLLAALTTLALADVRVNVRLGAGHPIVRPGRTVLVRPVRKAVVVRSPVVFAPPVFWTRAVVTLPPRDRMVWEDSETLRRREDWVDTTLGVDNRGDALFLKVNGRAQVDFAEVTFQNGQTQVVDFKEDLLGDGTYKLLDFADGRHVVNVRLVARARTPQATLTVLMRI